MNNEAIDKTSRLPRYLQVRSMLEKSLARREYCVRKQIPVVNSSAGSAVTR